MRICFISTMASSSWGGSEILWSAAAREALREGNEVAILRASWADEAIPVAELRRSGAIVLPLAKDRSSRTIRLYERFVYPMPLIRRWRPDVFCFSHGGSYEMLGSNDLVELVHRCGAPYVALSQHNFDGSILGDGKRRVFTSYYRGAAHAAFVSEENRSSVERQLATKLGNARVVRNPVNLDQLKRVEWPGSDVAHLASVARLDAHCKGQDLLIEALSGPAWKDRPWKARLYGRGPDQGYLAELIALHGLGAKIELRGHVEKISDLWKDNHLLVMPSRSEGTPLALVEAMVCGRPSVVSDVGGNTEWVREPDEGFVAEAPSVGSFGRALERAWQARDDWEQIGRRAHERSMSLIDPQPGKTLLDIIVDAAATRKAG